MPPRGGLFHLLVMICLLGQSGRQISDVLNLGSRDNAGVKTGNLEISCHLTLALRLSEQHCFLRGRRRLVFHNLRPIINPLHSTRVEGALPNLAFQSMSLKPKVFRDTNSTTRNLVFARRREEGVDLKATMAICEHFSRG